MSRDDQNRIEQSIAEKIRAYGIDDIEMPKTTRIMLKERLSSFVVDTLTAGEEDVEDKVRAAAAAALRIPGEVMSTLNAEKRYRAAMKHWESYETWKKNRNPARAELERRYGYDTKHAMHLIRLMRMGLEVLQKEDLVVRRPDAEDLSSVREGALTFDELMAAASELQERMRRAAESTNLPADVDHDRIDGLVVDLMKNPD